MPTVQLHRTDDEIRRNFSVGYLAQGSCTFFLCISCATVLPIAEVYPFSYISCVRNVAQDVPARLNKSDLHALNLSAESNLSFKALVTTNETDDSEASNTHQGREPAINWGSTYSPYLSSGLDDPNSSYPYLPPVLEEPSSSFSEAADDDPVPAIEGLQISGDDFSGRELQACGYSINGAKQPKYLVTADDVDSYLAIEVYPLDDRKRKGKLVKAFANEQRKITCALGRVIVVLFHCLNISPFIPLTSVMVLEYVLSSSWTRIE
ncbi:hypothetical protein KSP40_PGU000957 [Platanthera guangdongensis]|uniref:Uncharacterized protein n=1 Tax=Platanthera guangdongensis TaxID=2320717 RepID=A0ABR2MG85_9ASPA